MFVAALTLIAASAVHASLLGPIDPFPGAAPPEALLGLVLAIAAVAAFLSWARAWAFAIAATLLALLGTVYGLTVTIPRGEPGDVVYHVSLLAGLIVAAGLLIRRRLVDELGSPPSRAHRRLRARVPRLVSAEL